jgi:hypothetical protein
MKWFHWLAVLGTLYFVVEGIYEFTGTTNSTLEALPDWTSVLGTANTSPAVAGGLDLATAAALYFFVLHKKLMA